jgi:hypothetical protein
MSNTTRKVKVGEDEFTLETFSTRKAVRVIRTIDRITKGVPAILDRWAEFTRHYEEANVREMDRVTARHYFAPAPLMVQRPLMTEDDPPKPVMADGVPVMWSEPLRDENTGEVVMGPDPLAHMTDADWTASDNKLRLPRSPSTEEKVAAVFSMALDLAEEQVMQLMALLTVTNRELSRAHDEGNLMEVLEQRTKIIMDAPADDLFELAVVAGELVQGQFTDRIKALGDRLPNALRLFGISPKGLKTTTETEASRTSSSETKQPSSTDSPTPTDGESDESSTEPSGVSSAPSVPA